MSESELDRKPPPLPSAQAHMRAGRLELRFPYNPATVLLIKRCGGSWSGRERCWMLPDEPGVWKALRGVLRVEVVLPPLPPSCVAHVASLEAELQLRRFSRRTYKAYVSHVMRCLRHASVDATELTADHVRAFLLHEVERGVSHASLAVMHSAIGFFAKQVLKRPELITEVPRPKRAKRLPNVAAAAR